MEEVSELIDNEWYIVRDSGEIPEIAYNSAIYFLTRAANGPQVTLAEVDLDRLKQAAVERYEEIILRDMLHENIDRTIYRGIARSIHNFDRFTQFCDRQNLSPKPIRMKAGLTLTQFLQIECEKVSGKNPTPVINCSFSRLAGFAQTLGASFPSEYLVLEPFCLEGDA